MADERYRIAAASGDGIVVNRHFGKAEAFYIYQVDDREQIHFLEKRSVTPVCAGGSHDDEKLKNVMGKLKDCKYLLVSRIGDGAAGMAKSFGIESYEIPGMIEKSIEQLIQHTKIKKLLGQEG